MKNFDIMCISESKVAKGNDINNFTAFNLENKSTKYPLPGIHGIQVYISDKLVEKCQQLPDSDLCCDLVIWIKVDEHFILGALYLPCENSKHHYQEIYDELTYDINSIKGEYNLPIMIIGDFNSRTGSQNEIMLTDQYDILDDLDSSSFRYNDIIKIFEDLDIPVNRTNADTIINNNGHKLIEMCKVQDLCIINGRVGSDKFVGGTTCADVSTIDYAICTPDLFPKITDFTVDNFDNLLSDKHNPIVVNLNLVSNKMTPNNQMTKDKIISEDIHVKCKWDESKKDEYKLNFDMSKINTSYLNLSEINATEITQEKIDNLSEDIKNILTEPAKITGMYKQFSVNAKNKKPNTNKPWFNDSCKNSKNNYLRYKKSLPKKHNQIDKSALKSLAKQHKKLLRKEKRKHDKEFNAKLRTLKSTNPGEYWRIMNHGRKKARVGNIELDTYRIHFSELSKNNAENRESVPTDQNQPVNESINEPFTVIEIVKHINHLKSNKSPGVDNILNEFLKHCPEELVPVIVKLFNLILDSGKIPTSWTIGIIKAFYKNKGDINDVNNYRGITLLSCLGKLFTSVINSRLYKYLTDSGILGNEQVGFRPKHSTLDHIFALQILSNFYISRGKQLFCAFVDYSKAFDFIDRTYLWQKLLKSDINGKILKVIRNMYENAKSHVSVNNKLSDSFPCQVGVRQGENLSPLLFAIYLNDFQKFLSEKYNGLKDAHNSMSTINELDVYLKIFCLLYADDTLILAESAIQLEKALEGLNTYCKKWALNVNVEKTKVIIFSKGRIRKHKSFKFGNARIDVVHDYVYLGVTFNYNGTFHRAKAKQVIQAK